MENNDIPNLEKNDIPNLEKNDIHNLEKNDIHNLEKNDIPNDECWMCRRTKEELESLNIELTHFDGTIYMDHTVCRACEDIIMELCIKIDEETFKERVKEAVKEILQIVIDSELLER